MLFASSRGRPSPEPGPAAHTGARHVRETRTARLRRHRSRDARPVGPRRRGDRPSKRPLAAAEPANLLPPAPGCEVGGCAPAATGKSRGGVVTVSGARKRGPPPRTWPAGTDQPGPSRPRATGWADEGRGPGPGEGRRRGISSAGWLRGRPGGAIAEPQARQQLPQPGPGGVDPHDPSPAPAPRAPQHVQREDPLHQGRPREPRRPGRGWRPLDGARPDRPRPARRPGPPGRGPRGIICARALAWGARRPWKRSRWKRGDGMMPS